MMNAPDNGVNQRGDVPLSPSRRNRLNRGFNYDSIARMGKHRNRPKIARENVSQGVALLLLLVLGGFAIAGPSGIIAWSENQRLLKVREQQVAQLQVQRDQLRNRVHLLDPNHTDPDLASQLLRDRLNVAHPDEMVMLLD